MLHFIGSSSVCVAVVSSCIEVHFWHGSWEVYAQISLRALSYNVFSDLPFLVSEHLKKNDVQVHDHSRIGLHYSGAVQHCLK